jgi:ribonuclease D
MKNNFTRVLNVNSVNKLLSNQRSKHIQIIVIKKIESVNIVNYIFLINNLASILHSANQELEIVKNVIDLFSINNIIII